MAKRRTKLELERELSELKAKVDRLSKLVAEPGEFKKPGATYVTRQPLADRDNQRALEDAVWELAADCDEYGREPFNYCFEFVTGDGTPVPGVDAIVAELTYNEDDGFAVHRVWPAIRVG